MASRVRADEPPEYAALKAAWAARLREVFVGCYPQLEGRVEMFDVSTPLSIEHYLPTGSGTAIGLDVNASGSGGGNGAGSGCRFTDFRVMEMLDMKTKVPGLWLTGQDALLCGVPLAQAAGLLTALRVAGPLDATRLVLRSSWLLLASLGNKMRAQRSVKTNGDQTKKRD